MVTGPLSPGAATSTLAISASRGFTALDPITTTGWGKVSQGAAHAARDATRLRLLPAYGATAFRATSRSMGASPNVFSVEEVSTTNGATNW